MKDIFRKREYILDEQRVIENEVGFGVNREIAEFITAKGYENRLNGEVKGLSDPFEMKNMSEICDIIEELINAEGSVLVYGDYDADGISAAAILKLFFESKGIACEVVLPRRENGYGLHSELIGQKLESFSCDLLITVDCGISDWEEIQKIQDEYGLEVIVTDHHELPERLPDCLCLNCKMGGYPFLSGSAVAFKLVQALGGEEAAQKYASLASVGIIADLMPLEDENRVIVQSGLFEIRHQGILSLLKISGVTSKCTVYDYTMKLCPKINAAGRVGDPYPALDVLLSIDEENDFTAIRLNEINEERKKILEETVTEADKMISAASIERDGCVFVCGSNWKHGILGIAASRYKEKYGVSAFVMMKENGLVVGSGRGTEGLNLFRIFSDMSELFVRFGGHRHSVGFSLKEERLEDFRRELSERLKREEYADYCIYYDLDYRSEYLSDDFRQLMGLLQPMATNDVPIYRVRDYCDEIKVFGQNRNHISFRLHSGLLLKGFFEYVKYKNVAERRNMLDFLFTLEYDSFEKRTVGIIKAMTPCNSLRIDEICAENLALSIFKLPCSLSLEENRQHFKLVNRAEAVELLKSENITVVVNSLGEAADIARSDGFDLKDFRPEYFTATPFGGKRMLIAPEDEVDTRSCGSLLYMLGSVDYLEIGYSFPENSSVYVSDCGSFIPEKIEMNRDICGRVYKALKNGKQKYTDLNDLWMTLPLYELSRGQMILAMKIFLELGLIEMKETLEIRFIEDKKADLSKSKIYSAMVKYRNGDKNANRTC